MFSKKLQPKQKKLVLIFIYLGMIGLGIISGYQPDSIMAHIGVIVSELFIKIFKCISLPIISLSIIVTLAQYRSDEYMKTVWQRTLTYTFSTTFIAATISCILYIVVNPASLQVKSAHSLITNSNQLGYFTYLGNIIPTNLLSPFLEQQVMGVLFLSVMIGIAARKIPDESARKVVLEFFRGTHSLFLIITQWIIALIPLALFGFITSTVIQLRSGMDLKGIGEYLLIIIMANLIQGLLVLPLWLKINNIPAFATLKGMFPALTVAFLSKSSVGTLPVTMNTVESNLNVKPEISRFVLPLCTSINMNGCAAFIFATVIYLMQNHGIPISYFTMSIWVFVATIAAIGNAGVPMGCFFLSISLLSGMNVPVQLMGLILPFYGIIDMIETALNVWSDACVTKVVNEKSKPVSDFPPGKKSIYDIELG